MKIISVSLAGCVLTAAAAMAATNGVTFNKDVLASPAKELPGVPPSR